jgi:hypothetical protein
MSLTDVEELTMVREAPADRNPLDISAALIVDAASLLILVRNSDGISMSANPTASEELQSIGPTY